MTPEGVIRMKMNLRQLQISTSRNPHTKNRLTFFISLLVVCLLILPKIVAWANEVTDAYMYSSVSVAQASIEQNRILTGPFIEVHGPNAPWQTHANGISERVAVTSFLVVFSQVTGLKLEELLFLPICGLLIIFLSYAFGRVFSKSHTVALLYAVFIAYERNLNNNIYYISLGFALHYVFLIVLMRIIEPKTRARSSVVLLCLVFIVSYLTYYSVEAFDIAVLGFISLLIVLAQHHSFKIASGRYLNSLVTLTLAFATFFLVFESKLPVFLESASLGRLWNTMLNYIIYVYNVLTRNVSRVQEFRPVFGNVLTIYLDTAMKILIVLPITAYALYHIFSSLRKTGRLEINSRSVVFFSLIAVGVLETVIYWSYGPAGGFRYLFMFSSLLAFYSLSRSGTKLKREGIFFFISLIIILIVFSKFVANWEDPVHATDGRQYYSSMKTTADWTMKNAGQGSILSDFHISGQLLAEAAFHSKTNKAYIYKFAENLDMLYQFNQTKVDSVFNKNGYKYLILSYAFERQAVSGDIWAPHGPPLGQDFFFFDNYTSLNKVYEDGRGEIYVHN